MLDAVIVDGGRQNVSQIACTLGMPIATAHRQVTTLVAQSYLRPVGGGRHVAGRRLLALLPHLDEEQVIANVAAPLLHNLAVRVRAVVQLGTLANDMVTYRIKTGRCAGKLFTRVNMQLEAYCSGIGKVLLAHLPPGDREAYLASGGFVALTDRTIIDPARLRSELVKVRHQGFAIDDGEVAVGLHCMAVPLRNANGKVLAAISISRAADAPRRICDDALLPMLSATAAAIEHNVNS